VLFVTQGDDGVDTHGAARGQVAREQGDDNEHERDGDERHSVGGMHAVEERGKDARDGECADEPK
jgi:hypothetical protein